MGLNLSRSLSDEDDSSGDDDDGPSRFGNPWPRSIRITSLLARRLPPDVSEIPLRRLASSEESWAMVQNLRERMGKPRHKGDAEDVGQGAATQRQEPKRRCVLM